jgi:hypothetical protein
MSALHDIAENIPRFKRETSAARAPYVTDGLETPGDQRLVRKLGEISP